MGCPAIDTVHKLMALAVDAAAAPGEARNAALSAVKLIKKEGLIVTDKVLPPPEEEPDEVIIKSKFESSCRECGVKVYPGDRVRWKKGRGVRCVRCYE